MDAAGAVGLFSARVFWSFCATKGSGLGPAAGRKGMNRH